MGKTNPVISMRYRNYAECPACGQTTNVIADKGFKYFLRKLLGDNRFMCFNCEGTWRNKSPQRFKKLHIKTRISPKSFKVEPGAGVFAPFLSRPEFPKAAVFKNKKVFNPVLYP